MKILFLETDIAFQGRVGNESTSDSDEDAPGTSAVLHSGSSSDTRHAPLRLVFVSFHERKQSPCWQLVNRVRHPIIIWENKTATRPSSRDMGCHKRGHIWLGLEGLTMAVLGVWLHLSNVKCSTLKAWLILVKPFFLDLQWNCLIQQNPCADLVLTLRSGKCFPHVALKCCEEDVSISFKLRLRRC